MKMMLRGAGLSIAAAAMSVVLGATPAFAYDDSFHTDDGDPGGVLYWTRDGDVVKICDIEADGYAVRAAVGVWNADMTDGTVMYKIQVGGNGNCAKVDASDGAVYNLTENRYIGFTMFLVKDDKMLDESWDHADFWNG